MALERRTYTGPLRQSAALAPPTPGRNE